ncbi:MAG: AAA family ATPase [Thermoprotei archaeon]
MFFDPRPKRRRVDLYDFDDEFNALKDYLGQPLTVVSGLRRTGKTSLIMTVLEEMSAPYIFVDMRGIVGSLRDLYSTLSHSVSDFMLRLSRLQFLRDSILKFLRVLRGVSLSGFSVGMLCGL